VAVARRSKTYSMVETMKPRKRDRIHLVTEKGVACGGIAVRFTDAHEAVNCKNCRRSMGIADSVVVDLTVRPSSRALDAVLGKIEHPQSRQVDTLLVARYQKSLRQIVIGAAEEHDGLTYDEIAHIANVSLNWMPHADDEDICEFAQAMSKKMAKKRVEGHNGWQTCSTAVLLRMLRQHVDKGDMVDVGNLAMMIYCNMKR
jgi:hypothetical protein